MNHITNRHELLHHKIHRHARHHVHRLRGKSETHRKVFAFSFAFTVTFIVFVLWYFLSLPKILETYRITKSENERINDSSLQKLKNAFTGKDPQTDAANIEIETIQ
ncbi:hypothetical protein H7X65_00640 [Candidatus Parcubacteria bacterium]|nr:hypothetical protein [Candidatus Parcubacteria bacterium]